MAPTLIQESGADARAIEDKRAELAAVREPSPLSAAEVREIARSARTRLHDAEGGEPGIRGDGAR